MRQPWVSVPAPSNVALTVMFPFRPLFSNSSWLQLNAVKAAVAMQATCIRFLNFIIMKSPLVFYG